MNEIVDRFLIAEIVNFFTVFHYFYTQKNLFDQIACPIEIYWDARACKIYEYFLRMMQFQADVDNYK